MIVGKQSSVRRGASHGELEPVRVYMLGGDAIVTYPVFASGWPAFTLNPRQHLESLNKLAGLNVDVVAVGHGEPMGGTKRRMLSLIGERGPDR